MTIDILANYISGEFGWINLLLIAIIVILLITIVVLAVKFERQNNLLLEMHDMLIEIDYQVKKNSYF